MTKDIRQILDSRKKNLNLIAEAVAFDKTAEAVHKDSDTEEPVEDKLASGMAILEDIHECRLDTETVDRVKTAAARALKGYVSLLYRR